MYNVDFYHWYWPGTNLQLRLVIFTLFVNQEIGSIPLYDKTWNYLLFIFYEIWKAEIVDHIPGPHQDTQPVLLQELEIVPVGLIAQELGQILQVPVARLSHPALPLPAQEVKAEDAGAGEQDQQEHAPHHHVHGQHPACPS